MNHDEIVILDFGSQYSHLLLVECVVVVVGQSSLLEFNVYCELFSCLVDAKVVMEKKNLKVGFVFAVHPPGNHLFRWSL